MAQFRFYDSTDAGAPVLDGTAGSMKTVLTKVLTNDGTGIGNAYGSTPCAGWTMPSLGATNPGTNKAVFRPAAGNRFYLRVDDTGSVTPKEAAVRAYETMTTVDAGVANFNLSVASFVWRKSDTATSQARAWTILADDRTLYIFTLTGLLSGATFTTPVYTGPVGFGDYFSYYPNDGFRTFLTGREVADYTGGGSTVSYDNMYSLDVVDAAATYVTRQANSLGKWVARSWSQVGPGIRVGTVVPSRLVTWTQQDSSNPFPITGGVARYTSAGSIVLAPLEIVEFGATVANGMVLRGRFRGLYAWLHDLSKISHGNTFVTATKNFQVIAPVGAGEVQYNPGRNYFLGAAIVETSNTLDTN